MAKIGTGAAEGKRTAYINANVLDGTEGMEVLENHAVVVEGRRIVDVVPLADADLSGCETFDLKGAYLLPGLINMHVHLAGNGKPQKAAWVTSTRACVMTPRRESWRLRAFLLPIWAYRCREVTWPVRLPSRQIAFQRRLRRSILPGCRVSTLSSS